MEPVDGRPAELTATGRPGFDAAVVGGGIAGAAACVALHRAGLTALWIAPPDPDAGDRVGESLAPAAGPILARLGLDRLLHDAGHRRSNATFSAWGTSRLVERNAIVHLEGPGWVLDRGRFETDLRASASGVVERRHCRLEAARPATGCWHLALADGPGASAGFLIDASGRAAVAARSLAARRRDDRQIAACAFLAHRDPSVEPTPATLIETVPDGWWYAALLPDGRLSLARFGDADGLPRGISRSTPLWREMIRESRHVAFWIADAGFVAEAPPKLHSVGTTWLSTAGGTSEGAGWAAIGDAAAAFDPLSSHGMTTALWSAARTAEIVAAWRTGDDQPLAAYTSSVAQGIERFRKQRAALYARERRFAGEPFWQRRVV